MTAIRKIADEIKSLKLQDAAELAKILKEELDLPDAAPMIAGPAAGGAAPAAEEKTEFDVKLESYPADKKIAVLKAVREITGLGLGEAKAFVESVPKVLKEGIEKAESEEIKKKIEAAGGVVKIQ